MHANPAACSGLLFCLLQSVACNGTGHAGTSTDEQLSVEVNPQALVSVMVTTTVQAPDGVFLSAAPLRTTPTFFADANPTRGQEDARAHLDLALLYQGRPPEVPASLTAYVNPILLDSPDLQLLTEFPELKPSEDRGGQQWELWLYPTPATATPGPSEWFGWSHATQTWIGDSATPTSDALPAATFSAVLAPNSPLSLSAVDMDRMALTNTSDHALERLLLIKSHPLGVGITVIEELHPGETRIVPFGPKEGPGQLLLEQAQTELTAFFEQRVAPDLAEALAASRSASFLETYGVRVLALEAGGITDGVTLAQGTPTTNVQVFHAELLQMDDLTTLEGLLATAGDEPAASELGRFAEARLQLALSSADPVVVAAAQALLTAFSSPSPQ